MPAHDVEYIALFADDILSVRADTICTVYTLTGSMVAKGIPFEELKKRVPSGMYIVNNKKLYIR